MKYNDFKGKVEKLGFEVFKIWNTVDVRIKNGGGIIAWVDTESILTFSTASSLFKELSEVKKEDLFELLCEIASTPIEEREEEKRYRLKLNVNILSAGKLYLVKNTEKNYLRLGYSNFDSRYYQTDFTESELKEIDETGFVREELVD